MTGAVLFAGLLLGQDPESKVSPDSSGAARNVKQTLIAEWVVTLDDPGAFLIEFPPAPPGELFPWADSRQVLIARGSKGETLFRNWVYSERKIKVDGAVLVCPQLRFTNQIWWGERPKQVTIRLIRELAFHEAIDQPVPSAITFDGQRSLMGLPIPSWAPRLAGAAQLDAVFGGMAKKNGRRAWNYVVDNTVNEYTLEHVEVPTDCDGSALRMTAALRAGGICAYPVACRTPKDWHATAVYHFGGVARMMDAEVLLSSTKPKPTMVMEGTIPFGIYVPVSLEMEVPKWTHGITNKRGVLKTRDVLGKGPIGLVIGGAKGLTQHPSLYIGKTLEQFLTPDWEKFAFPQVKEGDKSKGDIGSASVGG